MLTATTAGRAVERSTRCHQGGSDMCPARDVPYRPRNQGTRRLSVPQRVHTTGKAAPNGQHYCIIFLPWISIVWYASLWMAQYYCAKFHFARGSGRENMLSDTDAVCVDIYWGCVKTKGKESPLGRSMALTKTTKHTHTHTNLTTDNAESAKRLQQLVVVARTSTWAAAQNCNPTVAQTNTNSEKQSPTVCIHYANLFGQWKCFERHEIVVFDMSTVDIAHFWPLYTMDIAQYCPQ
jgi:hypothetical protein